MRWRLNTIASRIAFTAILVLVLFQLLNFALLYLERTAVIETGLQLPDRIAAITEVIDAVSPAERPRILAHLQGPLQVRTAQAASAAVPAASDTNLELLRRRLQVVLGDHHYRILVREGVPAGGADAVAPGAGSEASVEVRLRDGSWLVFAGPHRFFVRFSLMQLAVRLALLTLVIGLLSMLAARRLARPIADFALAAERLGVDTNAAPLAERGPHELRAATRAFNRMQERLRRFIADRTQMLAAMSHDLRTPLTRLRLRSEFIDDPELQRKVLADLDEMSAMVESALAFARGDGESEPRTQVDLGLLVEGLCEDAADAGGTVTFTGPRGIDVSCRPNALRRAVANLIENAVKYGGSARVAVNPEPERVVIAVDDDGPGIPPDEQEKVFAPFYRLDRSRNRDTGGVGLGLAVARTVARGHGGDVTLANRAEGGLSARLELPM
jgi:signal transduction histidine kinase